MNNLLAGLGLGNVEADPNAVPDGRYDGVVHTSQYVLSEARNTVAHAIGYKVTEGDYHGMTPASQYTVLGTDPKDANGNFPSKVSEIVSYTPTMTETAKQWYKKAYVDLGIPEQDIEATSPEMLVGIPVTFGVKKNGQYRNINFVERRDGAVTPGAATTTAAAPVTQVTGNISSQL